MNLKNRNGITLVALIVTIIILLILAGISIAEFTGHGLFAQAQRAKLEEKRSAITEWLSIKLIEEQANNPSGTAEEIIGATRENVINNQNELEKKGKDINIEDISHEENGEQVEVYFYVIVDEDVYKVEIEGVKFIGRKGEFPPIIKITEVTNTTNTITVTVETQRNEEGKIEYWIKTEDEEEYRKIGETEGEEESYTYEGLTQNKKYNIKVMAIAKNKKTAEATAEATTGSVPDLPDADITFTYDPTEWTNGSVTATASTTVTGYTIQTSKDGKTWTSTISQTFTANGTIYARLYDGTNYGGAVAGNVTNIDKTKPTIGSVTGVTIVSGNTGNITISGVVDAGGSGLNAYYISTNSTTPTLNTSGWVTNTASSFTKEVTSGGTYYVWVKDNAGNVSDAKSCTVQTAVASIGSTYYASVANAVSAASTSTITLLVNQTESVTIPSGKNITFNLNGKTLTGSITNNGRLVLKGGTINGTSTRGINNIGSLSFQSGTISLSNGWTVNNTGTFTMTGGTIKYTAANDGSAFINQGNFTMRGGTITSSGFGLVTRGGVSDVRGSGITITGGVYPAVSSDNNGLSVYENIIINGSIAKANDNSTLTLYDCRIPGNPNVDGDVIRVDGAANGYKVYLYDKEHQYEKVEFPTWGVSNGQNDIIWHKGTYYQSGVGYWAYTVKKSEHNNETGLYNTHVYVNGSTMVQSIEYTVQ